MSGFLIGSIISLVIGIILMMPGIYNKIFYDKSLRDSFSYLLGIVILGFTLLIGFILLCGTVPVKESYSKPAWVEIYKTPVNIIVVIPGETIISETVSDFTHITPSNVLIRSEFNSYGLAIKPHTLAFNPLIK